MCFERSRTEGILEILESIGLEGPGEGDGFIRLQIPVDLDTQIDIVADRVTQDGDQVYGLRDVRCGGALLESGKERVRA